MPVQNTGAYLPRFMNLYCCENLIFSPLPCRLLRVSVGSGSLHLVAVLLMAGSGVTSCGWLNLHSGVMRTHQVVSLTVAHVVNRRSLTVENRVRSQAIHVGFVVDKLTLGQVFLRVRPSVSLHQGSIFIHLLPVPRNLVY
jgi:hypothetical protein